MEASWWAEGGLAKPPSPNARSTHLLARDAITGDSLTGDFAAMSAATFTADVLAAWQARRGTERSASATSCTDQYNHLAGNDRGANHGGAHEEDANPGANRDANQGANDEDVDRAAAAAVAAGTAGSGCHHHPSAASMLAACGRDSAIDSDLSELDLTSPGEVGSGDEGEGERPQNSSYLSGAAGGDERASGDSVHALEGADSEALFRGAAPPGSPLAVLGLHLLRLENPFAIAIMWRAFVAALSSCATDLRHIGSRDWRRSNAAHKAAQKLCRQATGHDSSASSHESLAASAAASAAQEDDEDDDEDTSCHVHAWLQDLAACVSAAALERDSLADPSDEVHVETGDHATSGGTRSAPSARDPPFTIKAHHHARKGAGYTHGSKDGSKQSHSAFGSKPLVAHSAANWTHGNEAINISNNPLAQEQDEEANASVGGERRSTAVHTVVHTVQQKLALRIGREARTRALLAALQATSPLQVVLSTLLSSLQTALLALGASDGAQVACVRAEFEPFVESAGANASQMWALVGGDSALHAVRSVFDWFFIMNFFFMVFGLSTC